MTAVAVLAATTRADRGRAERSLRESGGRDPRAVVERPGRLVLEAKFDTHRRARSAVERLRNGGLMAVVGPAQRPGWFGEGGCVCQPWAAPDRSEATLVIEIDPRGGFGSGTHPTTLLVLDELWARVGAGSRVLDVGCGTGVLGIVAARLGASRVDAIDVAEAAVGSTLANAALNDVSDRVRARVGSVGRSDDRYDIVVANIHAAALVELAPALGGAVAPGGRIIVSGLSRAQVSMTAAAMAPLEIMAQRVRDDWIALVFGAVQASIEFRSSTDGAK